MVAKAYTEEELKKMLKSLLNEKKKAHELKEKLLVYEKEGGKENFAEKFDIEQKKVLEKQEEIDLLKQQLEKVKPAFQKLREELKEVREDNAILHDQLEKKNQQEIPHSQLQEAYEKLGQDKEELEKQLLEKNEQMKDFSKRFDEERQKLVEKLAATLSQLQRQTDLIADLRGMEKELEQEKREKKILHADFLSQKSDLQKNALLVLEKETLIQSLKSSLEDYREKLTIAETQLEQSDMTQLRITYEERLQKEKEAHIAELQRCLEEKEKAHQEVLSSGYFKLRELKDKVSQLQEESQKGKEQLKQKEIEIRQAQHHLAKKIKESTLLRDMLERQKMQTLQLQNEHSVQKGEIERLQSSLHLQKMHEEKMHAIAKERASSAEEVIKQWQDKYFALQEEWQSVKAEYQDLQKMKKNYEQMSTAMASLKGFLNNNFQ